MLSLIVFKLLIQRLYFWHVMLLHGCHCVCSPDTTSSIWLPSLDWLLRPIVMRCPRGYCLSLCALPCCASCGCTLHLMLPVCGHLITSFLQDALIVLYLPLYVGLELTHPILGMHLSYYTSLRRGIIHYPFGEWISICQLLCCLWPKMMMLLLLILSLLRVRIGVLLRHVVVFQMEIIAWRAWRRKCAIRSLWLLFVNRPRLNSGGCLWHVTWSLRRCNFRSRLLDLRLLIWGRIYWLFVVLMSWNTRAAVPAFTEHWSRWRLSPSAIKIVGGKPPSCTF